MLPGTEQLIDSWQPGSSASGGNYLERLFQNWNREDAAAHSKRIDGQRRLQSANAASPMPSAFEDQSKVPFQNQQLHEEQHHGGGMGTPSGMGSIGLGLSPSLSSILCGLACGHYQDCGGPLTRPESASTRPHGDPSFPEDLLEILLATPAASLSAPLFAAPRPAAGHVEEPGETLCAHDGATEDRPPSGHLRADDKPFVRGVASPGREFINHRESINHGVMSCQSAAVRTGLVLSSRASNDPSESVCVSELFTFASSELKAIMADMILS
jgi:hypothetical protein